MKISYQWLKDYVAIKLPPEKLAERLTILGLEVVAQEKLADDVIFEIEVTANRPDCLNHLGVAREIAAATKQKLKIPSLIQKAKTPVKKFIEIQDKIGCPRYIGKIIEGVKVGSSPNNLEKRLTSIGLRSVNNIADITNYLLLELGQPMHAFDLDKLAEKRIIVRRAKSGETIVTIDGIERKLDPEILVIADAEKPVAIAGIMGGKDTEVTENTRNVLLESAYFNPIVIRRGSRKLGLTSDASYHFERNVDIPMVALAANRAINLIQQLAGGKLSAVCDAANSSFKKSGEHKTIVLNSKRVALLLGQEVAEAKIKAILNALGLKVNQAKKNNIKITIPGFRPDLKQEEDLAEEIARHLGFDKLPSSLPAIKISPIPESRMKKLSAAVRNGLLATGLNEVITYSLINKDWLQKIIWKDFSPVKIKNPLSLDQEIMRPTLFPGFLSVMRNNLNHNLEEVNIFEVGKVYTEYGEIPTLGLGIMCPKNKFSLLDLKGRLEALFGQLKIDKAHFSPAAKSFFTQDKSFAITIGNEDIGYLGELSSTVAHNLDFKHQNIFLAQLSLEALLKYVKWEVKFAPLINFPLIRRDISLIIKTEITAGQIVELIKQEAGQLLKEVSLSDQYSGAQIPAGYKGLTYSLEFQAPNRTLSDNEVSAIHEKLCSVLGERLNAKIRR